MARKKYSKAAEKKIGKVLREHERGTLRSGGSGKKVTSRKQAIAIAISEARREGKKVPRAPGKKAGGRRKKTSSRRASSSRRGGAKRGGKTTARKRAARRAAGRKGGRASARKRARSR